MSVVVTNATFANAIAALSHGSVSELFVDDETTGVNPHQGDQLCGIAVYDRKEAYYFPFRHSGGNNLDFSCMADMQKLLTQKHVTYIGHNYKFDMLFHAKEGIPLPEKTMDTFLMAHLNNENEKSHGLKNLGYKYLGKDAKDEQRKLDEELTLWGYSKGEMWRFPPQKVAPYACMDVILTARLYEVLKEKLEKQGLWQIALERGEENLLITRAELLGMRVDRDLCQSYASLADQKKLQCLIDLRAMAKFPLNPGSPKQLQRWLGLPSVSADKLKDLEGQNDKVDAILAYRGWDKANSAYFRKFLRLMDDNHDLHCSFKLCGTISSRLSCVDPPMQAIPRQKGDDPNHPFNGVKDVLIARDGFTLVEADYSQAEIRVATHYAQERAMAELLFANEDIHSRTAENLGLPRFAAKTLNFSVIYGIGAVKLGENLKISTGEAKEYLDKYHKGYPGFRRLARRAEDVATTRKAIRLYTGRIRHFNVPEAEPHKAASNLVQGSVAEMVRLAMTRIWREFPRDRCRMLLQVHDSIIFEIENSFLVEALPKIREVMEDQDWCSIPLLVDIKHGPTWGNMREAHR